MAKNSLRKLVSIVQQLVPAARTAGTATGTYTDLQGYDSALLVVSAGVLTDGVHTITVNDSPDHSAWTAVPAANLDGSFVVTTSSSVQAVGYIGGQRYVQIVITTAGGSTGEVDEAYVVLSNPRHV